MNVRAHALCSTGLFFSSCSPDILISAVTDVDAFLEMIRFFNTLILNADEAEGIDGGFTLRL